MSFYKVRLVYIKAYTSFIETSICWMKLENTIYKYLSSKLIKSYSWNIK